MKIGILTFHRACNYGAVLQCYALQEVLRSMGHEVNVIDYRQPWTESLRKAISFGKIKQLYKHPKAMLIYLCSFRKRGNSIKHSEIIFNNFVDKYLNTSNTCYGKEDFPHNYDFYVIGSDQVWGKSCLGGKFDNIYMGDFPHSIKSKLIGYAISSTIQSVLEMDNEKIQKVVGRFSALSFREYNIAKHISDICKISYPDCVDPTLLCESSIWDNLINDKWQEKSYILIYEARDAVKYSHLLQKKAKEMLMLTNKNYEIIDMSGMVYDVSDFVSAFKYAKCVITTSFHATVFSVIFNRPFYSIRLGDGADGRYENLLNLLNLEQQCVGPEFEPVIPQIDYSDMENILSLYRKPSIDFLNNTLL